MERSESIKELAVALSGAQAKIDGAEKGKENPAFRSKYADLGAVWEAIQPVLGEFGLSIMFLPGKTENKVHHISYLVMHKSGEFIHEEFCTPIMKEDPQGVGSAITYARRYISSAVFGVCPEDDDGNAASGKNYNYKAPAQAPSAGDVKSTTAVPAKAAQGNVAPTITPANEKSINLRIISSGLIGQTIEVEGQTYEVKTVQAELTTISSATALFNAIKKYTDAHPERVHHGVAA